MTTDEQKLTYPERHMPTWVLRGIPFGRSEIVSMLRRVSGPRSKGTPRARAYWRTLDAIDTLHKRGFRKFPADKVLDLLIQAAREEGWY